MLDENVFRGFAVELQQVESRSQCRDVNPALVGGENQLSHVVVKGGYPLHVIFVTVTLLQFQKSTLPATIHHKNNIYYIID